MISPCAQVSPKSRRRSVTRSAGFTLIELMIAMAIFLIIGGAAMSLFKQHASLFNDQQYQIGLNVSLRNALAQMENDVVNAGTGWYNAANNVSSWPVGVTITNNVAGGATCHPAGTATYNAPCFDVLNVIVPDPATPPGQVYAGTGTVGCSNLATTGTTGSGTSTMLISPVAPTTVGQLVSGFSGGSQVIFVHVGTSGTTMTTAVLTQSATLSGANALLTFGSTRSDGQNSNSANDLLNLTLLGNVDSALVSTTLTNSFCSGIDWVVKVAPIKYWVDTTVPTNPTLTRTESGTPNPIASQIIGFKIGASTVVLNGGVASSSTAAYCYNSALSASPCYDNQFDQIRSIRISLIGRTPPGLYSNSNVYAPTMFTNAFDGQPYKIQALSIIVNPRNLSMND
ncbi:MAG: prepilin-type N-terminal cleavage/methylation domain-containing protein [Candidatus Acidiferrum sp.]